jgi:hypothetical protein
LGAGSLTIAAAAPDGRKLRIADREPPMSQLSNAGANAAFVE